MISFLKMLNLLMLSSTLLTSGTASLIKHQPEKLNIIDGNIINNNDYPFMASVFYNNGKSLYESHEGGATFISQNLLLTAAHVITDFSDKHQSIFKANRLKIATGGLNLQKDNFNIFNVKKIYRIPSFEFTIEGSNFYIENDLAIIEIAAHPHIKVATVNCYNSHQSPSLIKTNHKVRTVGWGWYDSSFNTSPQLRYGDATIKSIANVKAYLKNNCPVNFLKLYKPEQYMGVKAIKGKSANPGDSGGPLLSYNVDTQQYVEIGVTSWIPDTLDGQASSYVFYTNLTNNDYQAWIESIKAKHIMS